MPANNKRLVYVLISISVIAILISIVSLIVLIRGQAEDEKADCRAEQSSAFQEDAWTALSGALEGLRSGDDAIIEMEVQNLRNNPSISDRIEENC